LGKKNIADLVVGLRVIGTDFEFGFQLRQSLIELTAAPVDVSDGEVYSL
jgi:hypothetical protein